VQRERNAWVVPIDFLTKALGPALGQPVFIRRTSRLIIVGAVRVPEVAIRIERTAAGARVAIAVQPLAPHKTSRDGNKLTLKFDAAALDATPATGFLAEFASAVRIDGSNVVIDLGPQAVVLKEAEDRAAGLITFELMPAPPPPPSPLPTPVAAAPGTAAKPAPSPGGPPQIDLTPGLRTIAIDAGHGGDDAGALGADGTKEKDVTLQVARRLKSTIESRLGLRVLMTRDSDDTVTLDRRTEVANNNKADAFISLHANWSVRPDAHGAQIYTPTVEAPKGGAFVPDPRQLTVPVVGGGLRRIDAVPWDLAQVPYADQSVALGALLQRQLADHQIALFARPVAQAPMRILRAAHMPAVLIELGFLSNAADARLLTSGDFQSSIVESILAALGDVRRSTAGTEGR
jgi:N-acetylmuramoyl-L-alanine amidase